MIHTRSQISKPGAFSLVCQWVRISSQEHVSISTPNNIDLQSHPNFWKYHCFFIILLIRENSQLLHLFNCLRRIHHYKLQDKCKYIYKSLMTLIPSKWKRTIMFCNLRVCQHVFPRKQKFFKIFVYITDCIHLKNGFSKWFTKSIFFERLSPKKVHSQSIKSRCTTKITSQVTQLRHKTSKKKIGLFVRT